MSSIKLNSITEEKAEINFHTTIDQKRGTGYETNLTLRNLDGNGWVAVMNFTDMPKQETPEEAIDRMGLYLRNMAKVMKGKNIKHLNIDKLFRPVSK